MRIPQAAVDAVGGMVLKLRSARRQALLASILLLVILGGMSALAVWRVQSDRAVRRTLESRAIAVAELNDARAEFFLNVNLLTAGILGGDPAPFVEQYSQRRLLAAESIAATRVELTALNETEEIATLDMIGDSIEGMLQDIDAGMSIAVNLDQETIVRMAAAYEGNMWPRFESILADIEQLANGEQAKLVADRAAADGASDASLTLLIGLGVAAFLLASTVLAMFTISLMRPLASLQASARAITSGNREARAKVSGPEETASLARDFNEMTETLVERSTLLEESEGRFRQVLDVSSDMIYKLNLESDTFDYISPSVLEMTGFTQEEFIAMGPRGLRRRIHPEDRPDFGRGSEEFIELGSHPGFEYRLQCKDGEYRWLSDNRALVRGEDGHPLALVGTVRDITERKRGEEELRESEGRFRTLSASAPIGIFLTDAQGNAVYANEHLQSLGGAPFEENTGHAWIKFIHPDDREAVFAEAYRAAAEQCEFSQEFRILTKAGEERWVHSTGAAILSPEGIVTGHVGTIEDITERKRAEEALRESEELFRTLSASAPVGIFLMDDKDQVIYTNERLQAVAGVPPGGGSGEQLATAVHPDDREQLLAKWAKAAEERAELSQEYRILTPQGETRWIRMHVCPIFSADGSRSSVVGTVEEITEQRQAAEDMATRLRMESAIARASNLLAGPEDVDAALDLALRILGEAFGAERAAIFATLSKGRVDAVTEWHAAGITQVNIRQGIDPAAFPWLVGKMVRGEPVIVPDVSALPPEAAAEKKAWEAIGNRSMLAVSLISNGKSIGCVIFDNTANTHDWREEDVRLLRLASESIASFIKRQRAGEDKRKAYESIVLLLATAAEARDPYTEHHLQRIRGFAEAIAAEMGLPPDEITEIGLCSLLHDLGKMRIPDSVLTKPGALSEAEWGIMKQHPIWGEELLATHPWMKTGRQIARWHHERWDGAGYPDGLRAEQIPVSAAIVSVADGLDAMISDRPYKGAWPQQQAVREIRMHKGRQYSPDVVEAFNRALRKGAIKRVTDATLRLSELDRAA
jgi:PAS domain S-box-containing protein